MGAISRTAKRRPATQKPHTKTPLWKQYWKNRYLVLLFIPAIIFYALFAYGPLYGIQIAFKDFIFTRGIWDSPWVGLKHFERLFNLGSFWEVFGNTLIISAYKFIFGFPAPIILALMLNEVSQKRFKKAVQTISYLPHFLSWVVLGGLFMQFLSPSIGPINIFLKSLGIEPIYFLADTKWFRSVLVITSIWKGMGWSSIIYLAALSGVDPTLYEAATMDGVTRLQRIWYITLPSITPVITIQLIFAVQGLVADDFDQVYNLYSPAVYSVGDVLGTYVYRLGMIDMEYSFSTAVGLFRNIISFIFIILANSIAKRVNDYGLW